MAVKRVFSEVTGSGIVCMLPEVFFFTAGNMREVLYDAAGFEP